MKKISILIIFAVFVFVLVCDLSFALKMATTTSTENSGVLDVLLPAFKARYGIEVHAIAVGSGKALQLARNGDVDLLMVHVPDLEEQFILDGFGCDRKTVFYNDFIIIGSKDDPARVSGLKDISKVLRAIVESEATFVSRGDNSGTYRKEMSLWERADISPSGKWYMETGQGMGATLTITDEKKGYCLTDRGTFIAYEDKIDLDIVFEGDELLMNPYSVIAVNPERYPDINYKEAKLFIDWISSDEGKDIIENFRKNGKILFHTY